MTIMIVKIAASILLGFFAGPAIVYVFNHIPASWLCEYGELPADNPKFAEELKDPHYKRLKENPWRWVYAAGFMCLCIKISLSEYQGGMLDVPFSESLASGQVALAALISCWLMLIIALADLKYMIIPDQFVLLLVLSGIGFFPTFGGVLQPLVGMLIGGGSLLLVSGLGKLIFHSSSVGFGDVKLAAALGIVLGIKGTIMSIACAFIFCGVAAAAGLATKRLKKTDFLPLGPFLCGAAMAYILLVFNTEFNI